MRVAPPGAVLAGDSFRCGRKKASFEEERTKSVTRSRQLTAACSCWLQRHHADLSSPAGAQSHPRTLAEPQKFSCILKVRALKMYVRGAE